MTGRSRLILVLAAGVLAALSGAGSAGARDETEAMLDRARRKRMPTPRDRELAREYLSDWVDETPDDPALRRAFERVSRGAPPASEQLPALGRLHANYSRAHAQAVARAQKKRERAAAGGGPASATAVGRRGLGVVAPLVGIGLVVIAGGVCWILLARRRRTAA